jgi:hypothetical protein
MLLHLLLLLATSNNGTITGKVTDKDTRAPIVGVTVVAQGPQGELAEITDERGVFMIPEAPIGQYMVNFYEAGGVTVRAKKSAAAEAGKAVRVNVSFSRGVEIEQPIILACRCCMVDTSSTKMGAVFTKDHLSKLPVGWR